ncbi:hypothetical protein NSE01_14260 [Novosphingobium sediminis]|uniref:Lipoprotein n=1 Tax=Novosphingobium sediminis TaxID=707214 RepID=A0A512AIS7_9SPHN|nr:hypothetical protein NSE01_14260 [Novosphingobium sediminis]
MTSAGSMRAALAVSVLLPAALCLGGCQQDTDPGPGGVTVGEARALDEAAEMLQKRPAPPLVDATVPADLATIPASGAADTVASKP